MMCMLFIVQSCSIGQSKSGVWQNEKIDAGIKTTITALNNEVYKGICENNYSALEKIFSDSLRAVISPEFSKKFMPNMQRVMKDRKYRIFDEFYIRNAKTQDTVRISSGKGDSAWSMKFYSPIKEMYISMLIAGGPLDEVMLTLIYIHTNGKWTLHNVMGEDYSLNGKNEIQQYHYAQALQKNGSLIDAVNVMSLARHCGAPGGMNFRYTKDNDINQFSEALTNEAKTKYPFPYAVKELQSKPLVVNVHYEVMDSSMVPMIIYQSSVSVYDTAALKTENDAMQKNIGSIFPGMDKNNNALIYRAYNELPNGQNNPRYYGYIQKLK